MSFSTALAALSRGRTSRPARPSTWRDAAARLRRPLAAIGVFATVLLLVGLLAPGWLAFVAVVGGCLAMHLFGHGGHGHAADSGPEHR